MRRLFTLRILQSRDARWLSPVWKDCWDAFASRLTQRCGALSLLTVCIALGCAESPAPPAQAPDSSAPVSQAAISKAPAPPSAAVSQAPETKGPPAPPELRKAWRDSVKYRSAFSVLVRNIQSLKGDRAKMMRMVNETRMFEVIPVAPRPAEDAATLRKALEFHAERLELKDVSVSVKTHLPAKAPPRRVDHSVGIEYSAEQLMGTHQVTLSFPSKASAKTFVTGLRQLPRMPLVSKLRTRKGRTVITGTAPFFTDLQPAEVFRPAPRVEGILSRTGGTDHPTAAKLRANYAQVDALAPQIKTAFELEAALKLLTSRFSAFTAHAKALEQMSWRVLTGKAPKAH